MYAPKQLKRVLTIATSFEQCDAEDRAYWHAQTPEARWREMEELRQLNYGHPIPRLQRVLEVVKRTQR